MVIDPGDDLAFAAVSQEQAGRHVQLPQLHRSRALPPPVLLPASAARHRLDQLAADQHPVDGGPGQARIPAAGQLEHQAARAPAAVCPAQLADHRLDLAADLPRMMGRGMGAIRQPGDSFHPIARDPPVHRLPGHPVTLGDLNDRDPGKDLQDSPVSLLDHIQLPKHERERHASSGATVSHIKRSRTRDKRRSCYNFHHGFKGAPSARRT
jgi:hypothetical protein